MKNTKNSERTRRLVTAAMMTTLVIVFQLLATYTAFFGPFSTAIGLIPIAIGACICGPLVGAWLGLVFGIVVLATGGAALFFAFSIPGTIITVLLKGAGCGFIAGLAFKIFAPKLKFFAAIIASLLCPIVNTGIFLLGSAVFFMPHAQAIGDMVGVDGAGFGVFIALAFANFIIELLMCGLLSPVFVRIIKIVKLGKK
ncbi:MAG: ECF transporter S component [Clostridia bacterium]|nr:ECF transporter S component [Clostridia bacterium]